LSRHKRLTSNFRGLSALLQSGQTGVAWKKFFEYSLLYSPIAVYSYAEDKLSSFFPAKLWSESLSGYLVSPFLNPRRTRGIWVALVGVLALVLPLVGPVGTGFATPDPEPTTVGLTVTVTGVSPADPISGAAVYYEFYDSENDAVEFVKCGETEADGDVTCSVPEETFIEIQVNGPTGFLSRGEVEFFVPAASEQPTAATTIELEEVPVGAKAVTIATGVTGAQVYLSEFSSGQVRLRSDTSGNVQFQAVSAGSYTLSVYKDGYLSWDSNRFRFSGLTDASFLIALPPEGDRQISGLVTLPGGGPVEGVDVRASFFEEASGGFFSWFSQGVTGEDGSFSILNVPAKTAIELRFDHEVPGYFQRSEPFVVNTSAGNATRSYELVPLPEGNFTVSGTIRDGQGQPRGAGVPVTLTLNDWENGVASFSTTATGQGSFELSGLPFGEYFLSLGEVTGFLSWSTTVNVTSNRVVNVLLAPVGTKTISGKVTNSATSAGIPDVEVSAFASINGSSWNSFGVETNAQGDFSITDVPSGEIQLFIYGPDGFYQSWDQVKVDTTGSGTSFTQNFALEPLPNGTQTISGTVTKRDGSEPATALDGVTVYLSYSTFGQGQNRYYSTSTVTAIDGTYEFGNLWPGQYWLWAECSQDCSGFDNAWGSVRLQENGPDVARNFGLRPLPAADSDLTLRLFSDSLKQNPIQGVEVSINNTSFGAINAFGRTNASGEVTFSNLPAGTYTYWVNSSAPGFSDWRPVFEYPSYSDTFIRVSGTTSRDVVLTPISYADTRNVSGTLVDQRTNTPISGAQISLSSDGLGFWTTTATNGQWSIPSVPAGKYWVSTFIESSDGVAYTFIYQEVDVPAGAGEFSIALATRSLAPGSGSVTAVLRDKATHARITSGETVYLSHESANFFREAQTVNGEVTFSNLPPGGYYLSAESNGYLFDEGVYVTVEQTGNTQVSFRGEKLNRSGSLTVNVKEFIDTNDTPAVEGAWISIAVVPTDPTQPTQFVADLYGQTDETGQIVFGKGTGQYSDFKIPVGRQLELTVDVFFGPSADRPGGLVPHTERFTLSATAPNNDRTIDVLLMPGGSLSGEVTVPAGQSPAGLYVSAFDAGTENWVGWAEVAVDGKFTIDSLPEGKYVVLVEDYRSSGPSVQNAYIGTTLAPVSSRASAAEWTVESGATTEIKAGLTTTVNLVAGVTISGVVNVSIDGSAQDLPAGRWVFVDVLDNSDANNPRPLDVPAYGWTSGFNNGAYSVRGLAPGDYLLQFVDGFSFSDGFSASSRLYETVDVAVTVTSDGLTGQNVTMSVQTPDSNRATAFTIDADADLEGGIGVDSSLGIAATVDIQLPQEMAGEWVLPVANSTAVVLREPGATSDGWVQVRSDGTVSVELPEDLVGQHKIGVRDADDRLVGWSSVTISNNPAASTGSKKSSKSNVQVLPAGEVESIRQWMQSPTGARPTQEDGSPLPRVAPEPPATPAPPAEEAPTPGEETQTTAVAESAGIGTLLWWVLGILVAVGAITALVLIVRRRLV
jgi:hypothetical protein